MVSQIMLKGWRRYMGDIPYEKTCPDLPDGEGEDESPPEVPTPTPPVTTSSN